jgi:hypothetical protein
MTSPLLTMAFKMSQHVAFFFFCLDATKFAVNHPLSLKVSFLCHPLSLFNQNSMACSPGIMIGMGLWF